MSAKLLFAVQTRNDQTCAAKLYYYNMLLFMLCKFTALYFLCNEASIQ